MNLLNIITYPFVWAVTWVWRNSGAQAGWAVALELTQGLTLMTLMANRDTIANYETKLLPILGTIHYTIQINLISGYCFYQANFTYSNYDSAALIELCEDAAMT